MARILPSDWRAADAGGAAARELETLALLEHALPDELTVFHGVHWTRVENGLAAIGEIDFAIVSPAGRVLLVEQKSGFLEETPDGLVKRYRQVTKSVRVQVDRTLGALRRRLAPFVGADPVPIEYLLYCPDYVVRDPGSAGIDPARIVDARAPDGLPSRIRRALTPRAAGTAGRAQAPAVAGVDADDARPELCARLHRFFANELALVPDAGALLGRAEAMVTRLSGGLATWARRIEASPLRVRVQGTAGSGKTQLALALLQDAANAGRRARYVCFNRPLADHLRQLAPDAGTVSTYHQWCERRVRAAGGAPDFAQTDSFARLEADAAALPVADDDRVDDLIVDEGQDFAPAWREDLFRLLGADRESRAARCWWLEDPMQNLYDRPAFAPEGWVTLNAPVNYRCPRQIVGALQRLVDPELAPPVQAQGPIEGEPFEIFEYADGAALLDSTKRAITSALRAGFRRQDIAIVTFGGRERSGLLSFDALGPHRLRRFVGRYDLFGRPEFSEGDLLVETVYRFKGQSAPCVILAEVDFEVLDARAQRKFFVGATRASMRLIVIASVRAAAALRARLGETNAAQGSTLAAERGKTG